MTSKCVKMSNGSELWLKDQKLHREDGPAIYRAKSNTTGYYLKGKQLSFEKWIRRSEVQRHMTPQEVTFMMLKHSSEN